MNDDEKFDTWVVDAARDYNRPPTHVPREAMWQAIQPAITVHARPRASWVRRWVPLAAAAAVLVVVSYRVGVSRGSVTTGPGTTPAPEVAASSQGAFYRHATEQHLENADALLTSLRAAGPGTSLDSSLVTWSRALLADTRLLLDSPAATDASRRRLLEDLELLLAQIVQLSAAATSDDHDMVDRKLERGELLTRIRTAVPGILSGT